VEQFTSVYKVTIRVELVILAASVVEYTNNKHRVTSSGQADAMMVPHTSQNVEMLWVYQHINRHQKLPNSCRFLANRRDRFAIDTTRRTNMATNPQQNLYSQLEHLQSKYVGTGHPDISRHDWCTNMARDSIATYLVRHIFSIAHI